MRTSMQVAACNALFQARMRVITRPCEVTMPCHTLRVSMCTPRRTGGLLQGV